jgi:hypothetical protein
MATQRKTAKVFKATPCLLLSHGNMSPYGRNMIPSLSCDDSHERMCCQTSFTLPYVVSIWG